MFMPSGTTYDVAARNGQERRAWQRDRSVEIVLPVRVIPVILLSHCLQSDVDFSFSLGTNKALRVNISVIKKSEVLFISSRLHSVSRHASWSKPRLVRTWIGRSTPSL
jgi:hypothetical protein